MKNQTFDRWLKNHPCDTESLWLLQNCLGSLYGFDSLDALAASKAWEESRKDPANCRHMWEELPGFKRCVRCHTEEKGECGNKPWNCDEKEPCADCKKVNQVGTITAKAPPCSECKQEGYITCSHRKPSEEERWNALLDMLINYTDVTLAKANEFRSKFL